MYEGDVRIKEAASDGIHANDDIVMESGALAIRSTGDGIESEKDVIRINGGQIDTKTQIIVQYIDRKTRFFDLYIDTYFFVLRLDRFCRAFIHLSFN
jgi:hypothetical protein